MAKGFKVLISFGRKLLTALEVSNVHAGRIMNGHSAVQLVLVSFSVRDIALICTSAVLFTFSDNY